MDLANDITLKPCTTFYKYFKKALHWQFFISLFYSCLVFTILPLIILRWSTHSRRHTYMERPTYMCRFFTYVWRLVSGTGSALQGCGIQPWIVLLYVLVIHHHRRYIIHSSVTPHLLTASVSHSSLCFHDVCFSDTLFGKEVISFLL